MKVFLRRYLVFLAASVALASMPWAVAATQNASERAVPSRLAERHPATLSGRMDRKQSDYVDLYAPLSPAEWERLEAVSERWHARR